MSDPFDAISIKLFRVYQAECLESEVLHNSSDPGDIHHVLGMVKNDSDTRKQVVTHGSCQLMFLLVTPPRPWILLQVPTTRP